MKFKGISKFGKIFAILMVAIMAFTFLPGESFAETSLGKVHVIVENTTFTKATADSDNMSPKWSGTLVDTEVELKSDSTMMSVIVDALSDYEVVGAEIGYISSINGLAEKEGASGAGWMGTLNDWFVNEGFQNFTVEENELKNGDEIRVMYTCNLGVDLRSEESNTDKSLKSVTFNSGKLDKTFAKGTYEYTLKLLNGTTSVKVTPTAANKNYQVKTYVGETEYKRTQDIPVSEGTVITVKCGDKSWPSMSDNTAEGTTYTFTVAFEEEKDVASGTDGNINWVIKYDGTLVISAVKGTDGKMKNYTTAPWNSYKNDITKLVIEDGVASIGNSAFKQLAITSAEIPNSVKSIGNNAFQMCKQLKEISIPCSVTGMMTFGSCTNLETVTFTEGCESLGKNIFFGCNSIKTINLPKSLKSIEKLSFNGCSALETLTVVPGGLFHMENGMLCKESVVVFATKTLKKADIPEGITEIGESALANNANLTEISFPSTLTKIGNSAFSGAGITKLVLPKHITSYGNNCFSSCENLTSVVMESNPEVAITYGNKLFYGCSKLKNIEFSDHVTALNKIVQMCGSIQYLDLKNVTSVQEDDLYWMTGLKEIYIHKCLTEFKEEFEDVTFPEVIYYEGSEEDWNKITFGEKTLENIKKHGFLVIYNYKGTSTGDIPTIKNKLSDQTVSQYLRADSYKAELDIEEGAKVIYRWYCNDEFVSYDEVYSQSTSKTGEYKVYAKVSYIKDGKVGEATTNIATVTVNALNPIDLLVGKGTEEEPYLLRNAEDLSNLSALVEYYDSFEGKYFKMTDDIELPEGWKPIGTTIDGSNDIKEGANLAPFSGIINGDNHRLTVPKGGQPLLGYIKGAEVKNLRIYGEQIDGYGLVNNYEGVGLKGSAIIIDNVTIENGSRILKSGLIGGNVTTNGFAGNSAGFLATIKNCTVEENVIIGYDGTQTMIGSFAGRMQGTIENCVSYATVKGQDCVGGIIGARDNALGECTVKSCKFYGKVEASGKNAGGISGSGYAGAAAPNGMRVTILDCYSQGTIIGKKNVGGIIGGDTGIVQSWGDMYMSGNTFAGTVIGEENVGGIIGYYASLNKHDVITNNTYTLDCGAKTGIGSVKYIDTNCANPKEVEGTTYINTGEEKSSIPGITEVDKNRTDDPLGADSDKLAKGVKSDKMLAGEVDKLIENIDMTSSDRVVKVAEARTAYNALSAAQKALVTKLETLTGYEAQLTDEEKAEAVDELIDEIGTPVTLGAKKAVRRARKAYDDLTPAQKNLVENYAALERAERELSPLVIKQAEDLINDLPKKDEITINDKEAIEEARAAYDELTEDEQKEISKDTLKKLTDAEKAYEKLVPKTGDSNNVIVYSMVLMLSVLALMGTVVYKKRKSM